MVAKKVREKNIENKIKDYLKTIPGLFFFKEHGGMYGTAGIPDLILCYEGLFIALEIKTATGKTTKLQEATIRSIKRSGGIALVVRTVEEVQDLIELLKKIRYERVKRIIEKSHALNWNT